MPEVRTNGMAKITPFHIAVPVRDIPESRAFYTNVLGCREGRSAETWVDFDMFGHQVVVHLNPNLGPQGRVPTHCNPVDSHAVPVPHFGVVLTIADWQRLAVRARTFVDHFIMSDCMLSVNLLCLSAKSIG